MGIFETYIYQPFFNILVGIYYLTSKFLVEPDMGIAVIFFAVAVRLILLPFDMIAERSDEDKYKIAQRIQQIKKDYSDNPIAQKEQIKVTMRQSPGAIISELFTVLVQFTIIIVLYRIFTTGLEGDDMHLLYSFMPKISEPVNLLFLGKYDLSHTNPTLNLIQSLMISLNEFLHLSFSPVKPTKREFLSLVVIFPVMCFLVFMLLPAGKKVFIISSLAFTIIIRILKHLSYIFFASRHAPIPVSPPQSESLVVSQKEV